MVEAEPVVGEIYATRTFGVTREGLLTGLHHHDYVWQDGENTATCNKNQQARAGEGGGVHRVPVLDCRCGFYGYTVTSPKIRGNQVLAVISCSGRIVAGELGVRSEKARIVALFFGDGIPWTAKKNVEGNYPSAVVYDDKEQLFSDYGLVVEEVPNTGTFQGFKQPKQGMGLGRLASWKKIEKKQTTRGSDKDLKALVVLLKLGMMILFVPVVLCSSLAALGWLIPSTISGRDAASMSSLMHGVMEPDNGGGPPWFALLILAAGIYVSAMSGTKNMRVSGVVSSVVVLVTAVLSPVVLSWHIQGGSGWLMSLVSVLWLVSAVTLVYLLVSVSFSKKAIMDREDRGCYARTFFWNLGRDVGLFVYAPSPPKTASSPHQV